MKGVTYIACLVLFQALLSNSYDLPGKCIDCLKRAQENKKFAIKERKKDLFVSRGWGAGGMPFSVLYMNPMYSSKAPIAAELPYKAVTLSANRDAPKSLPQVRTATNKNKHRVSGGYSRSVIPQLFVSYGWGPLGQK